ncbi:MAG: glycosyltransferase family 39 protein [Bacteroidota bacterium]
MTERNITLDNWVFYGLLAAIVGVYVAGIGANSIWTTHESYYAVAVREMLESGDWLTITFNGDLRFNKPPLTYWLMAASASIFGLKEWALRLPILLCSLGTLFVTYRLGVTLFSKEVGRWALLLMAVSLQFAWLKHYASPEIPLTFFFTLTMYGFFRGLQDQQREYLMLAFASLSLTMLVKGWPYFLVVYAVLGTFLLLHHRFCLSKIKNVVPLGWFLWGSLVSLLIGLSWLGLMYLRYEEELLEVLHFETSQRTVRSNQTGFWKQWFFYPEAIVWSFFPGSLVLYYALVYYLKKGLTVLQKVALPIAWLGVMLLGFTLAQGKLPAYILQAHPAMALLCAYFIVQSQQNKKVQRINAWLWGLTSFVAIVSSIGLVVAFHLSEVWYLVIGLLVGVAIWQYIKYYSLFAPTLAVTSTVVALAILFISLYPSLEQYRPYRAIQQVIVNHQISEAVPMVVEERFIHNMPFYAERKVLRDRQYSRADIVDMEKKEPVLGLVKTGHALPAGYQVLWQGWLYRKGSESHGFRFIVHCWQAYRGNYQHFQEYQLVYQPPSSQKNLSVVLSLSDKMRKTSTQ